VDATEDGKLGSDGNHSYNTNEFHRNHGARAQNLGADTQNRERLEAVSRGQSGSTGAARRKFRGIAGRIRGGDGAIRLREVVAALCDRRAGESIARQGIGGWQRSGGHERRFDVVTKMLGLDGRLEHRPSEMSGGEQQRVAIARAIINEPKILLADEPTGNLDTKNSEIVLEMLRRLNKDLGQTIVMITHNPEATTYFDRVVHMRDGVIVDGVPAD
jgi:ABC-type phosphate/phosphonate transport system ATPase subunit